MYSFTSPAAFVPHSAINLSVKPGQEEASPPVQSLDLSVSEAGPTGPSGAFEAAASSSSHHQNSGSSSSLILQPLPPVLDLTRPLPNRYADRFILILRQNISCKVLCFSNAI